MNELSILLNEDYHESEDYYDDTDGEDSEVDDESPNSTSEETEWRALSLEKKFREVMESLAQSRRWSIDDNSTSGRLPMEEWKKAQLLKEHSSEDRTAPTLLHLLAKHKEDFCKLHPVDRETMIKDALRGYQSSTRMSSGDPILGVAVLYNNDEFMNCLIDCLGGDIVGFVGQPDQMGQNCLHKIFRHPSMKDLRTKREREKRLGDMKRQALERGRKIMGVMPPEAIMAKDTKGNTPLHYAMSFLLSAFREDDYVELVKSMLEKEDITMPGTEYRLNIDGDSPILFYERTKAKFEQREERKAALRKKLTADREAKAQTTPDIDSQVPLSQKHVTQRPVSVRDPSTAEHEKLIAKRNIMDKRRPDPFETRLAKGLPNFLDKSIKRPSTTEKATQGEAGASQSGSRPPPSSAAGPSIESRPEPHYHFRQPKIEGKNGESRYTERNEELEAYRPIGVHQPKARNDSGKELLNFFTRHYLRTRTDLEARSLIYGRNKSVINLSLDASGHDNAADIVQLITRMSHGGFSETLAYVSLPTVVNEEPKGKARLGAEGTRPNQGVPIQKEQNPDPGRTVLTDVFNKLYEQKVRSILRLEVEDRRSPSHADAAIEAALRGRDSLGLNGTPSRPISVETWDWRKPDLNIDVIIFAAPDVVTLNLYWSGNEAILKGWSSHDGIPKLKKLKNLRIIAAPGLGTRARMDKVLEKFESDVRGARNGAMKDLEIAREVRIWGLTRDLDMPQHRANWKSAHVQGERQHAWIQHMEGFRSALRTIHDELAKVKAPEPQRVKVALLDDGVDLNQLTPYHGQTPDGPDEEIVRAFGISCCDVGQGLTNWAISSQGHGTIMANMILRINPWVELYSMKIQDSEDALGRRTILPGSAANAVHNALGLQANIISMSWSIRNKSQPLVPMSVSRTVSEGIVGELRAGIATMSLAGQRAMPTMESPLKALEDAVGFATERGTLMFCSATDDIQNGAMDFLPYQRGQNHIFRIGAAMAHGERDPQAEDEKNTDYFFPGNQVADAVNPRSDRQVKYHDGSSVSTALATGLSSLIMYLARVMSAYYKHKGDMDRSHDFEEWAKKLQMRQNMRQAFTNIDHVDWENKKFLPVWEVFGDRTKRIKECRSLEAKMKVLDELVKELCSKVR